MRQARVDACLTFFGSKVVSYTRWIAPPIKQRVCRGVGSLTDFHCLLATEHENSVQLIESQRTLDELMAQPALKDREHWVKVEVAYSSLNYKDALAAEGHRGVIKRLPHIPGIDCSGVVVETNDPNLSVGDSVVITGNDLGQGHWGGWAEFVCVPSEWVVPLPATLSLRESMVLGTAGFTAAQCVLALQQNEIEPGNGRLLVTGATGGVGSLALRLLVHLGYETVAVTGKVEQVDALYEAGASAVLMREEMMEDSKRPLLSANWVGGVDTVGGAALTTLLRSTKYGGVVAACGLVAGAELEMTVYPFILRGVRLCGVASADCPTAKRLEIWERLATDWKLADLDTSWHREVRLAQVPEEVRRIKNGEIVGRVVVRVK